MRTNEFIRFCTRRAVADYPWVFLARMARYALIAPYMPARNRALRKMRQDGAQVSKSVMGNIMLLDPNDLGISSDLLLDGIREPLATHAFRRLLRKDDVCLDIGANIGYYAMQEARLTKKVYAIEPVTNNFVLLLKNISENDLFNIEVCRYAIGSKCGEAEIMLSPLRNMCTLVEKNGYRDYIGKEKVRVLTLDEFIKGMERPTVVRMDVEAFELEVIKGAKDYLSKPGRCLMFIEVHCDILREKTWELARLLKQYGFHVAAASFEPHAAVKDKKVFGLIKPLERIIGASGYTDMSIDDFSKYCFTSGQVEDLEVIFIKE